MSLLVKKGCMLQSLASMKVLNSAATCKLDHCRLATQLALLGEVPEPFQSPQGLVKWQEAHRRKLQQSKGQAHCFLV